MQGLDERAPDEAVVLDWMQGRAHRGVVQLDPDLLVRRIARAVSIEIHRVEVALVHLEDAGSIERVVYNSTHRFFLGELSPTTRPQGGGVSIVAGGDGTSPQTLGCSPVDALSVDQSMPDFCHPSAQTTVYLARYFFPQVLKGAGLDPIPPAKCGAVAHHLNQWKAQGVSLATIKLMMEEFGKHADWCRRSRKPAWRVFLARYDELLALVKLQQRRDPGNRRYSAGKGRDYWNPRPTPRAYSPA